MKWNAEMPFKLRIAWPCKLSNSSIIPCLIEKRVFTFHLTRLTRVSTRIFRVVSRFDTCQSFRVTSWHGSNVSCHPLTRFKKLTDTNLTRNETNRFETFQPDTCHSLPLSTMFNFFFPLHLRGPFVFQFWTCRKWKCFRIHLIFAAAWLHSWFSMTKMRSSLVYSA